MRLLALTGGPTAIFPEVRLRAIGDVDDDQSSRRNPCAKSPLLRLVPQERKTKNLLCWFATATKETVNDDARDSNASVRETRKVRQKVSRITWLESQKHRHNDYAARQAGAVALRVSGPYSLAQMGH